MQPASMPGTPAGAAILRAPGGALDHIAALLSLADRCAEVGASCKGGGYNGLEEESAF